MRVVPEEQYAKALLRDGRLIGAVLIGDTDLEEVRTVLLLFPCVWGWVLCVLMNLVVSMAGCVVAE